MTKVLILSIGILFFIQSISAESLDTALTPDETIIGSELVEFPNDNRIYANKSDFKILHNIIMSNIKGERWATITVTNLAHGRRSFNQDQVLALFADGTRRFPLSFSRDFKSDQTISVLINFGENQFPILKVMTRN